MNQPLQTPSPFSDAAKAEILAASLLAASAMLQLPPLAAGSGSHGSSEFASHWSCH